MKHLLFIFLSLLFISCSSTIPTIEDRTNIILDFASQNRLNKIVINSANFNIFSLQPDIYSCENRTINIYIEGDGLSWIRKNKISDNPTPVKQTLLNLSRLDKNICKIYLARPCQYIDSSSCNKAYWTNKRFSKEIINSFDEVLNILKSKYKNKDFNLIGYSGGGAVATLLASQRNDIKNLITIAGNLDIEKWVSIHKISKLDGSLNPADFTHLLENIKQYHIVGNIDEIVPKDIFMSFYSKVDDQKHINYIYADSNHSCCFKSAFEEVLNKINE